MRRLLLEPYKEVMFLLWHGYVLRYCFVDRGMRWHSIKSLVCHFVLYYFDLIFFLRFFLLSRLIYRNYFQWFLCP